MSPVASIANEQVGLRAFWDVKGKENFSFYFIRFMVFVLAVESTRTHVFLFLGNEAGAEL